MPGEFGNDFLEKSGEAHLQCSLQHVLTLSRPQPRSDHAAEPLPETSLFPSESRQSSRNDCLALCREGLREDWLL